MHPQMPVSYGINPYGVDLDESVSQYAMTIIPTMENLTNQKQVTGLNKTKNIISNYLKSY